jgi:hypothetical protein
MTEATSPKLGAGEWNFQTPVRYPNVYSVERTSGPERLVIGPARDHLEVLLSLAEVWQQDYYLLYVLLVPRQGKREPGRYQSPGPLTFDQVATFCRKFSSFLQGDGRHHLWIGSTVNAGLLIYDQHEWIWAYGDLPAYTRTLQAKGFTEGEVSLPVPHSHNYNSEFDAAEDELVNYWEWTHFPLQPDDEY